ncbi:MAG TPA: saccharopine dehydrogenase NADP-binding domain-containing protein [Thermoleophilaceae bacterium]|nr:saccharopine dehydrogenase NADP-binding domain-containing protein [Thermoleophilaceae bacterium]
MAGRIVVFGATGYTGRLTAEALVARGQRPVLAARDRGRLAQLATELGGGLETAVADVARPETVMELVGEGDVLVSTVGPFVKFGDPAAEAAIAARAHYLDSTGEPPFIRRVFEHYGPQAERAGIGMLTAFGYDWVPGNLAAALALRDAGERAVRVDTGYFVTGAAGASSFSGGTKASLAAVASEPAFAFRDGTLRTVRSADRHRAFALRGRELPAVSVGSSEHFGLPATHPGLREVNSYLGWFGPLSRPMQAFSLLGSGAMRIPGARALSAKLADRLVKGSTGGPGPEERARSGSYIVAEAYDAEGAKLAEIHLTGVDPYGFTAGILAWGARRAATDGMLANGALGPDGAFGLDELEDGCREAGLTR